MHLNLPILNKLSSCQNLLIAGMGGGFDIFCGLPIYFELQRLGLKVHLANLSFSNIVFSKAANLQQTILLTETLAGITAETEELPVYFPELYLAQWLKKEFNTATTIWCFKKTGVLPLVSNYNQLIEHLSIDGILLIDGGVDSLARGDEADMGTVTEDAVSIAAVSKLTQVPLRLIGCLGMGAERNITHLHILENIASLANSGGFLGSCSLLKQMQCYQDYEKALLYVQSQPNQEPSIINSSIISSVQGHFGDYHLTSRTKGSKLWISPLMSIYWFFELSAIVEQHLFLSQLFLTETLADVLQEMLKIMQNRPRRIADKTPLP
ncbi:DUF1152 domain-containing protein [Sphaerospermopsis aphanizomenoides BCCUSP55]|uniref:DUF1152 domain-containing protein n=1 Tax=Sphaerospermopsis aphanizomenoides TaxID=459663 RepID=UPI001905069E|nr:DUF1152 domain-containing protein [Sphaerospermopsis aphanizomenoides]MBK1988310.1 DUF1152 domain-containing protein [Sphaerospermopsis aphanizomenoides BCCUSP55]